MLFRSRTIILVNFSIKILEKVYAITYWRGKTNPTRMYGLKYLYSNTDDRGQSRGGGENNQWNWKTMLLASVNWKSRALYITGPYTHSPIKDKKFENTLYIYTAFTPFHLNPPPKYNKII